MPSFNEILNVTSERVLKRPLNDEERREILELAGVLGMKEVQEYLYMILTFKFHEDRLGEKLERMTQVSECIRDVLQEGTEKMDIEVAFIGNKMRFADLVDNSFSQPG